MSSLGSTYHGLEWQTKKSRKTTKFDAAGEKVKWFNVLNARRRIEVMHMDGDLARQKLNMSSAGSITNMTTFMQGMIWHRKFEKHWQNRQNYLLGIAGPGQHPGSAMRKKFVWTSVVRYRIQRCWGPQLSETAAKASSRNMLCKYSTWAEGQLGQSSELLPFCANGHGGSKIECDGSAEL